MTVYRFQNRKELVDMMVDTLNRLGSSVVPERALAWIMLHEARANRVLRDRQQTVRATATLIDSHIRLPNDFKEAQSIQIVIANGKPRPLTLVTPEYADQVRAEGKLTEPAHFCIVGNYLEVVPHSSAGLQMELVYFKGVPPLEADTQTNWLLQEHPDYYFYGALVHSAPYLRDDERIATWGTFAQTAQDEMLLAIERARHSGSRLKTRARLRC